MGGGGVGWGGGGQGGCERRIEVFGKIHKIQGGGRGYVLGGRGRVGGVRVDVTEEMKFLGKFTDKKKFWGGGGGQGGYERRIKVFVKIQEKKFGGGGEGGLFGGVGLGGSG